MELLSSGVGQQSYRIGPAIPSLGEGFHRGFVSNYEVTLRIAPVDNPTAVAALQAEEALLEQLSHRQIAMLLDRGQTEKFAFLVLDGPIERPLVELMSEADFGVTTTLDVILQVLDIIKVFHSNGLVWGWVRPRAFWVDRAGRLRLVNVRGANATTLGEPLTLAEAMYLAPEHAQGQPLTFSSDVYSCGVLAYELLAGKPPFVGASIAELMIKHLAEPLPDLIGMRPNLPSNLVTLIESCLAKVPTERPADVVALHNELELIYAQLSAQEQAQMVICPRCHGAVLLTDRCPLCNAPLHVSEPPPPPPPRRIGLLPKMLGLAAIATVIALPHILGINDEGAVASGVAGGQNVPARVAPATPQISPTRMPTPIPTATAMPTPPGMLTLAADDIADPNIDIVRARAATEDDYIVADIEVVGQIYGRANEAMYQIFLDTDNSPDSGDRTGPWQTLGANYAVLYRSGEVAGMVLRWENAAWQGVGAAEAIVDGGKLQLRFPATWLDSPRELRYGILATNPVANLTDYAPARSAEAAAALNQ